MNSPHNSDPAVLSPIQPASSLSKLPLIIVGLLAILAAGAGGVYLGKYLYGPNPPAHSGLSPSGSKTGEPAIAQATPTGTLSAIPTQVSDQTANWETYKGPNLGIEFSYPKEWFVTNYDSSGSIRVQNYNPETAPGREFDSKTDKGLFAFVVGRYGVNDGLVKSFSTVSDLRVFLSAENAKECFDRGDSNGVRIIAKERQSQIGDLEFYSRMSKCSKSPDSAWMTENFLLSGKGDVITINPFLDVTVEQRVFDQILSTVRFLK